MKHSELTPCPCRPQSLISILDMYEIAAREGRPQSAAHEGEFWAYHLLTLALIGAKAKEDGSGGRLELTTNFMVRAWCWIQLVKSGSPRQWPGPCTILTEHCQQGMVVMIADATQTG